MNQSKKDLSNNNISLGNELRLYKTIKQLDKDKEIILWVNKFNPEQPYLNFFDIKKTNEKYVQAELNWYLSKNLKVDYIEEYAKLWTQIKGKTTNEVNSNYGWCVFDEANYYQYDHVKHKLLSKKSTKQACMIYTRPSMWIDNNRDGMKDFMCFEGETEVLSPEGNIKIKDLYEKIQNGEKYPVYCVDFSKNERTVSFAINAFKKKSKKLVKVTLDNGLQFICTKDHRFFVRKRVQEGPHTYHYTYNNEVEAQDLKPGMSLIRSMIHKNSLGRYGIKVSLDKNTHWKNIKSVHRFYYEIMHNKILPEDIHIHHRNHNYNDNRLENLIEMNQSEHMKYHQMGEKNSIFKLKDKEKFYQKVGKGLSKFYENAPLEYYENRGNFKFSDIIEDFLDYYKNNERKSFRGYLDHLKSEGKTSTDVFRLKKYLKMTGMTVNDLINENHKVVSVEHLDYTSTVYDIEVDKYHNFFVGSGIDGVLVHNCTNYCQTFIREDKLRYIIHQRSCDFVFGFFNDFFWHCYVYNMLYEDLNAYYPELKKTDIDYICDTLHIYQRHYELVHKLALEIDKLGVYQ